MQISKQMLNDCNYSNTVLNNKEHCIGKFGKFIYLAYKIKSAFLMTLILLFYGKFFEKENTNGF